MDGKLRFALVLSTNMAVAAIAASAGYLYYDTDKDIKRFIFVAFGVNLANSLVGLSTVLCDNPLYCLHYLLDYLQLVLAFPCFTAEVFIKHGIGSPELAALFPFFGGIAASFYILQNYQRQDLTDLANITSIVCCLVVASVQQDWYSLGAAMSFTLGYLSVKRNDSDAESSPYEDFYTVGTAAFTGLAYLSITETQNS